MFNNSSLNPTFIFSFRLPSAFLLDHKFIGFSYIFLGLFSGLLGFYMSFIIRLELISPYSVLISNSDVTYYLTVTYHGIIMIFYAAMPIFISGLGNLLIPFYIGTRDMVYPRLNLSSLFILILSFIFLISSTGVFSNKFLGVFFGWTLYPPLSLITLSPSLTYLILALHLNGTSSIINSINAVITILYTSSLKKWHTSPYVWSMLVVSFLIILVTPILAVSITLLLTDNLLASCFYSSQGGGDPVLFQHLFWFFGHPEVYILILPVFGLVSEFISEFATFRLSGYKVMIWSLISISFVGCFVWGHHMYTTGFDLDTKVYFTLITTLIAIPTALKVILWLTSFTNNNLPINLVLSFILFFILTFIIGGVTGVWLAQAGLDILLHDTYFIISHFHYVLAVSLIYIFFSSIYNWFYFFTSFRFNLKFSKIFVISFIISTNLSFFPMHFLGLSGLPRRVLDYPSCFTGLNYLISLGTILSFVSLFWFMLSFWFFNFLFSGKD